MKEQTLYLLKIGELALKGGNRKYFERTLKDNIRIMLSGSRPKVYGGYGRFFLSLPSQFEERAEKVLASCFGLTGFVKCTETDKDIHHIQDAVLAIAHTCIADHGLRFKIESRRTDKGFEKTSYELSCLAGSWVTESFPSAQVDVKHPQWTINIEIREQVYVYGPKKPGLGGLPVGVAGKGILLLSGGIDSPVAGYMMSKRGLSLSGLYFHAYPFTSQESLDKVKKLAAVLKGYQTGMKLHVVDFTKLQIALKERGPENELTLHMRAAMMSIAQKVCEIHDGVALVTGESLSQVASQTAQSIRLTNSFCNYPVFRPLIGMDKEEIIRLAKTIGTFETSILPYEDCCTVFSPKNPQIRPRFEDTRQRFFSLDVQEHIEECIATIRSYEL